MGVRVPHHILAIDDIPANLLTLKAILPEDEFVFTGCSDAEDAFRALERQTFDLVLLDVLLPGIDGYAIARNLKADPRTAPAPIIFLTALQDEDEVVKGFESGGVDFVSKPFHKTELLLRVRTHLALKDKNEALARAAEELRQANQARDRFFSILAHDLKNPFAGLLSLIQEVLAQYDTMDRKDLLEILQTMGQTSQNVYRLLETLLDWGRSQTGALSLEVEAHRLAFLVEEALEPLEEAFRRKEIGVRWDPSALQALCDRYTVVAIVRNLLSNALKFTRQGGSVTILAREVGGEVELLVTDTGVGIPGARLALLFHMENKMSTPGTNREPGTGLGLILCAEFARKNHGSLRVESTVGVGTTFALRLPATPSIART
jgi:two-component system sensor histidine kinase/response regulator